MDNYIHPQLPSQTIVIDMEIKVSSEIVHMYSSKLQNTTNLKALLNNVNYKIRII